MAASATQPTSYLSDPNATAAYQTALAGAADLYSQYGGGNAPVYNAQAATQWANTVPGLLAAQTPYQVNAAQQMGNMQGYMNQFTNPALGYATSSAVPINQYQVGQSQIDKYMSPYLNNVLQSAVANINETNAQQQQQLLGNAISKGAFGGDRAGIAQAALARQQNLSNNATLANILNTGYGQALGEANQQQGVAYGAQIANNQMANAAANLMSNLGTQAQTAQLQQLQAQYNMGAAQQAQDQNAKNIAYQQYQNYMQQPYQQAKYLADMASGAASALGGTTVASIPQPSTVSQIAGGIGALAGQDFSGISNLFKNRGGSVRGAYATGGRMGYAEGGSPSAGQQLSDAYSAYTQAARAGADMPTLKALYNNYINVKNEQEAGGANIGQSALGNQIRGYQYPTAQSLENANSSSAGGVAAIAGMLANLLKKKGGGGGGGGAQVPQTRNVPTTTPQQAKPVETSFKQAPQNAVQSYLGALGNTAAPLQYLQTTPSWMRDAGVSMSNILKDNPNFNAPLALEASRPHTLPAEAGGSNLATLRAEPGVITGGTTLMGQPVPRVGTYDPSFVGGLSAQAGRLIESDNPRASNNIPNMPGVTSFGINGPNGVAPINNVVDRAVQAQNPLVTAYRDINSNLTKLDDLAAQGKISPTEYLATRGQLLDMQSTVSDKMQNAASASDAGNLGRGVSAAELAAATPVQVTGVGGQLSGLADLSNNQAIQAASQLGLNNLSPDQLMAAGFTPDQAAAIGAANSMPQPDQGVGPITGGNVAAQVEQNMMAPEGGQSTNYYSPTPSSEPSAGSQEVWNNSYDMALANGMTDTQAINYADSVASQTNQLDTTQPTYTDSSGQTVDALGRVITPNIYQNPATSDMYNGYSPVTNTQAQPDTVSQNTYNGAADLPSPNANNVSYDAYSGQTYVPTTPTVDTTQPSYSDTVMQPYTPTTFDTGPSYVGPTYDPNSTYDQFVSPSYNYVPDTSYYSPSYSGDYGSADYYNYNFSPSFDYGGYDFNRGGGVHERKHRAVGGPNIQTGPSSPVFGIAPISMNYGLPSSGQLQGAAENVAGSGVVPVSQGMQALAARDFLGGGNMYRGGVVKHRG